MFDNETFERRTVLRGAGVAAAAGLFSGTAAAATWTEASSPTTNTLYDATYTADGPFAVGGNGVVLERDGEWRVVVEDGPSGNGNDLYGSGVTDDGESLWVVGASGAVGEYDVPAGELFDRSEGINDFSAPDDYTGNFRDVAATGDSGSANVFITDDSGILHYSFDNGETWDEVTPGSGSTIPAVSFYDARKGHLSDTNQKVFATTDGTNYDAIGIGDVDENFYGVDSNGEDDVWVCGNRGMVFDYDGSDWSETTLGDVVLRDIDIADDTDEGFTVGSEGRVFSYDGTAWSEDSTPVDEDLKGLAPRNTDSYDSTLSITTGPDVAVGDAGTIIEHQP